MVSQWPPPRQGQPPHLPTITITRQAQRAAASWARTYPRTVPLHALPPIPHPRPSVRAAYPPALSRLPPSSLVSQRETPQRHAPGIVVWVLLVTIIGLGGILLSGFALSQHAASVSHMQTSIAPDTTLAVPGTWDVPCPRSIPAATGNSESVIGPPSISTTFIDSVLSYDHSPAQGLGQTLFDASTRCGIDPVFTLAFFMHESSFGTAGEARSSLSPGNLRCIAGFRCQDGYAWFASWQDGFTVYCRLLRNLYVDAWGLVTIEQIIPTYAPSGDHNDVTAYEAALTHAVAVWRAGQIVV